MVAGKKDQKLARQRSSRLTYLFIAGMCFVLTALAVYSQTSTWASGVALFFGGVTTYLIFVLYRQSTRNRLYGEQMSENSSGDDNAPDAASKKELDMNVPTIETSDEKDEFISIVSHELRTPLNAISGWTRILRNSQITKETRDHALDVIEKNIRTQSRLVNELIDYSQVVSDTVIKKNDEINISAIFEKVAENAKSEADRKNITFEKKNLLETGKAIGDSTKLEKMFLNVLLNAVKFTPRGGKITAIIQNVDEKIQFRVIDSGEGIEHKNLGGIFERFSQADSSTARKYGGFGLGLAFSRQVAALHDGEIRADSAGIGKGSAFTVDLPIKKKGH